MHYLGSASEDLVYKECINHALLGLCKECVNWGVVKGRPMYEVTPSSQSKSNCKVPLAS